MNRRQLLLAALALHPAAALAAGQQQNDAVLPAGRAKLARPGSGLIRVLCAVSRATTKIDYVGPEAVFESYFPDEGSTRPVKQFEIFTVAESPAPVSDVVPHYTFANAPTANVIVVAAQAGSPALHEWLRSRSAGTDVTMSVCNGARHLAIAGLLDGRVATTHHNSIAGYMKEFPKVKWIRDVRFVEGDRISTSAGLTSGIDLALRIVERYFSRAQAQFVADHLEHESSRWKV